MKPRLQELRREAGYRSAKAYAEHLGMNPSTYTEYEQGRVSMPIEKAWQIADDLGVSLDELMGRTPPVKVASDKANKERAREVLYMMINLLDENEGGENDN